MRRLSRESFVDRFPMMVPAASISGIQKGTVALDEPCFANGIFQGDLIAKPGAKLLIQGIIEGRLIVEQDAIVYSNGIVKGDVVVHGAACLDGIINGSLRTAADAAVCLSGNVAGEQGELLP